MKTRYPLGAIVLIALFILSISSVQQNLFYTKITHSTDPEAKCLDGSPPAFYIHQGSEKSKFFLYFIGGGFCGLNTLSGTLEDCYQRSKTRRGSSYLWPDTFSFDDGAEGMLSLNETVYANWTKIMFTYCDGALHQGSRDEPVSYKDTKLYFRGNKISRSHFKYLIDNYDLLKAEKIMLSGGSAGAVAVMMWGNYLQSLLPNPSIVYNVPDCGIFLNLPAYKTNFPQVQSRIKNIMSLAHGQQKTPLDECNSKYPGEEWRCIFLEHNYPYLKGKYLFVNSQYDAWAISNILLISCVTDGTADQTIKTCSSDELQSIHNYRNQYMRLLNQKVKTPERSIWSIACVTHCYLSGQLCYDTDLQKIPAKYGLNPKQAVQQFVIYDRMNWLMDYISWPGNQPCAY